MDKRPKTIPTPKRLIYDRIAEQGVVSKAELLSAFSMTSSTLTRVLEEMLAERLLLESGLGNSSGGRRPILYQINPTYGYIFGLEISRLYSSLGLFDMQMNPRSFTRWQMDEAMTPDRFIDHVASNMKAFLRDHHIDREHVLGVGIGAVGPLSREKGIILKPLHFPARGWTDLPICELMEASTGFNSYLENGTNTALMGEQWAHRQENVQHMIYVHAGAGLRSAMMSHGQIVHGTVDMEGSIGHMIIQTDGPRLHDYGNYGALEAYASVQALEKQARSQLKRGRADLPDYLQVPPEHLNFSLLVKALHQDDPFARELFIQSATYFGIGLANLINVFHPEKIIVGGALINSHDIYYQTAIEVAQRNTYYSSDYQPVFSKGTLREDAVATGAAIMVWKNLNL
ncbi:ROK family protein [Paenibacillus spongiae]|uniref:ROK family protein n=1 Tax=Paenibacillus spongiae TaxID=2909671 RepID=A0ABY5SBR8_9BACL|nr:ROK family protein [Paenibacillus spongiae]UVI31389.1 ROK family protein [Paenibacillus spongiae]